MWKEVLKVSVAALGAAAVVVTFSAVSPGSPSLSFASDDDDDDVGISKLEMERLTKGREMFQAKCAVCHGYGGVPELPEAPDFSKGERMEKTDAELIETIKNGKDVMPPWKDELSEEEIVQVLAYSRVVPGDSVFARMCLDCHSSFVPAVSDDIPSGAALVKASEAAPPPDFCSASNIEVEMEPEEVVSVIKFIRSFQEDDKNDD